MCSEGLILSLCPLEGSKIFRKWKLMEACYDHMIITHVIMEDI